MDEISVKSIVGLGTKVVMKKKINKEVNEKENEEDKEAKEEIINILKSISNEEG